MGTVESERARYERYQDLADRYSDALCDWITADRVRAKVQELAATGRVSAEDLLTLAVSALADAAPRGLTGSAVSYDTSVEQRVQRLSGLVMAELQLDFDRECDEISAMARLDARDAA